MVLRLVLAMMMGMELAGLHAVMGSLGAVTAGALGMVGGDLGFVFFIMPGGQAMMMRGLLMMFGRRMMMCAGGMLVRHIALLAMGEGQHTRFGQRKNVNLRGFAQTSRRIAIKSANSRGLNPSGS